MFKLKIWLKLASVTLIYLGVCALLVIVDYYLLSLPRIYGDLQVAMHLVTLFIGLAVIVHGISRTSRLIVMLRQSDRKSDELLLRAGLDPTDFQSNSSVRPPNSPQAGE